MDAEAAPLLDHKVDSYSLVRFLGRGAMGAVYEARRDGWQVRYALKVLDQSRSVREAEVHQHFRHPNIVAIHDSGQFTDEEGRQRQYIVMDLVPEAQSITQYADEKGLDLEARVRLMIDVCSALEEEIHRKGGRHLDIKPGNLLVDDRGAVRIADLGVSRLATDLDVQRAGGTVAYMPPEQLELGVADLDERADVFAVGATLHELATGLPPHIIPESSTRHEALDIKRRQPSPSLAHVDRGLDTIVHRALEPDRNRRTGSAGALGDQLRAWLERRRRPTARAGRAAERLWRRPTVRAVGLTLCAALVASLLGGLLARAIWPLVKWESVAPAPVVDRFEQVQLVAVPAGEEVEALAAELGIPGVSASEAASWRPVHAALCDRLAGVAKAIAFDFHFEHPHPADATFAEAIRRARQRGTAVVSATRRRVTNQGVPEISPVLWDAGIHWGYWSIGQSFELQHSIPLLTQSDGRSYPSLSLATAAAAQVQRAEFAFELEDDRIVVRYQMPIRSGLAYPLAQRYEVVPTVVEPYRPTFGGPAAGFELDDMIAYQRVDPPTNAERQAATVPLKAVLRSREGVDRLQRKIVVVFDAINDPETWLGDADGPAAYLHAASIEAVLAGRSARWVQSWGQAPVLLALGALGAWLGFAAAAPAGRLAGRRMAALGACLLGAAAAGVAIALVAIGLHRLTLWLAGETLLMLHPAPGACAFAAGTLLGFAAIPLGAAGDRLRPDGRRLRMDYRRPSRQRPANMTTVRTQAKGPGT